MSQVFTEARTLRDFDTPTPTENSSLAQQFGRPPIPGQEQTEGPAMQTQGASAEQNAGIGVGTQSPQVLQSGGFTEVDVDNHGLEFASEWRPTMATPDYIGETSMLLEYLKRQERLHKVTMPIRACGIDPILFSNVKFLELPGAEGQEPPKMFEIPAEKKGEDQGAVSAYELIQVDNNLYLSCVSECLDRDYLNSVIAEATSAVKACGKYIFQMVGYKKLALEEGKTEGRLLDTLKLNSYEMSALISYMGQFDNIRITYQVIDNKQCICFER